MCAARAAVSLQIVPLMGHCSIHKHRILSKSHHCPEFKGVTSLARRLLL